MPTLNISKTDRNITECFLAILGLLIAHACLVKILTRLRKSEKAYKAGGLCAVYRVPFVVLPTVAGVIIRSDVLTLQARVEWRV